MRCAAMSAFAIAAVGEMAKGLGQMANSQEREAEIQVLSGPIHRFRLPGLVPIILSCLTCKTLLQNLSKTSPCSVGLPVV